MQLSELLEAIDSGADVAEAIYKAVDIVNDHLANSPTVFKRSPIKNCQLGCSNISQADMENAPAVRNPTFIWDTIVITSNAQYMDTGHWDAINAKASAEDRFDAVPPDHNLHITIFFKQNSKEIHIVDKSLGAGETITNLNSKQIANALLKVFKQSIGIGKKL
jgi:hypothetical protein